MGPILRRVDHLAKISHIPSCRIQNGVAEHFEEDGLKKGVAELAGVAARAAQPVCLFQDSRDALLLGLAWEGNWNGIKSILCDVLHRRAVNLCNHFAKCMT